MNAIFGPFASLREETKAAEDLVEEVSGAFIFLRSIGKVFLQNGMDYTFSLPFLVHKAWPLHPHGILIQRILDQAEVDEARATGDDLLPTMFTITSPFSEPAAVGVTRGIMGGSGGEPVASVDEGENYSKFQATGHHLGQRASCLGGIPNTTPAILVTFDVDNGNLSIWRYVYIKPKDAPVPMR